MNAVARACRVLVVTDQIPGYEAGFAKSGHAAYLTSFLDHFCARGCDVTLVALRPRLEATSIRSDELPYRVLGPTLACVGDRYVVRSARSIARTCAWKAFGSLPASLQRVASSGRTAARGLRGFAHDLGRFVDDRERRFVGDAVAAYRPELLIYDGIFNACGPLGDAERWLITHEVKYQRAQSFRERDVAVRPAGFDRETERAILADVGNLVAIQWDDADELRRLVPEARVIVVPVAIDVPAQEPRDPTRLGPRLVFVGSGSYHNYDGIRWFLDRCWSSVRARIPEATLDIVGTVCLRLDVPPPGVRLCGVVEDLAAAYAGAALAIVPLQIGSGLKVKLIEALAHGMPVVTTSIGAQGLAALRPEPFVLADRADEFADRCVELLASHTAAASLSVRALSCARRFTPERAFAEFGDATSSSVTNRPASGRVLIAVPTFRRPALLASLLDGICAQRVAGDSSRFRVAIIDNDPERSAEAVVAQRRAGFPFALDYVSMIEPGLSSIRNHALAIAREGYDLLAMIDDDEVPEPQWLAELLDVYERTGAEAVVGPVEPVLPPTAAKWISDFHNLQVPSFPDGALLADGWSGNCLLDIREIARLAIAFDPMLNFAGGEDQLFFRQLLARGGRIAYASRAMAWEHTPMDRRTVRFLMSRSFRRGNTLALCDVTLAPGLRTQLVRTLKGVAFVVKGVAGAALGMVRRDPSTVVSRASDAVTGVGMLAGLLGMTYQAYRRSDAVRTSC